MATQPPRLTPEEYLEIERKAEYRREYFHGEMFAMSGASEAHEEVELSGIGCRMAMRDIYEKVAFA